MGVFLIVSLLLELRNDFNSSCREKREWRGVLVSFFGFFLTKIVVQSKYLHSTFLKPKVLIHHQGGSCCLIYV